MKSLLLSLIIRRRGGQLPTVKFVGKRRPNGETDGIKRESWWEWRRLEATRAGSGAVDLWKR
jgi:hypothetical protein